MDDEHIISRYEKLAQDIDDIYRRSEDLIGTYTYDDGNDTFIDPWSKMEDTLGLDILLQVAKFNKLVQN